MNAAITWAGRVIAGTFAIAAAAWVAVAWRSEGRRVDRLTDLSRHEPADDLALTLTCKPCHGEPGHCQCPVKCGNPVCGAADTGVSQLSEDDVRWLRSISVKGEDQ
jgi:hypothetical protein